MKKIKILEACEILDSRGNPTVEVVCVLESGVSAKASVPSGASTGVHEALELRDHDQSRYSGKGVLKAVQNINVEILEYVKNKEWNQKNLDQALIDLDGTENKSRLGANAILGVSLAFARASAVEEGKELYEYIGGLVGNTGFKVPQPMFNILNGGKHANNGLDVQEFLIAPVAFENFREKVEVAGKVIDALKNILIEKNLSTETGDEGGFAPRVSSSEEPIELIMKAIKDAGYGEDQIKISLDVAASSFYQDGVYKINIAGETKNLNSKELIAWYQELVERYPIASIEDGLDEEDWEGFRALNEQLGSVIRIVGDDLLVTNLKRIQKAITEKAVNCVLIKPNQIGTLSEAISAVELAHKEGWSAFVSHRSGETMDTFIADLSAGLACEYIKAGALSQKQRICKYDRLIEIEDKINENKAK